MLIYQLGYVRDCDISIISGSSIVLIYYLTHLLAVLYH
jgi:hypothetical protein